MERVIKYVYMGKDGTVYNKVRDALPPKFVEGLEARLYMSTPILESHAEETADFLLENIDMLKDIIKAVEEAQLCKIIATIVGV